MNPLKQNKGVALAAQLIKRTINSGLLAKLLSKPQPTDDKTPPSAR